MLTASIVARRRDGKQFGYSLLEMVERGDRQSTSSGNPIHHTPLSLAGSWFESHRDEISKPPKVVDIKCPWATTSEDRFDNPPEVSQHLKTGEKSSNSHMHHCSPSDVPSLGWSGVSESNSYVSENIETDISRDILDNNQHAPTSASAISSF